MSCSLMFTESDNTVKFRINCNLSHLSRLANFSAKKAACCKLCTNSDGTLAAVGSIANHHYIADDA